MTSSIQTAFMAELCAPPVQAVRWTELGYAVHPIPGVLIDRCESEPSSLEYLLRAEIPGTDPAVLAIACDELPGTGASAATNWDATLHQPLARCFTVVRGLTPWIARHPRGGHVIAFQSRASLLPDAERGSAAVLGRSLLGLFESLRAELRQTPTRVTICMTDSDEPSVAFHERLRGVLSRRPFYSLPASITPEQIESYFAPMLDALARTPRGTPLPAGPQGEVYHLQLSQR